MTRKLLAALGVLVIMSMLLVSCAPAAAPVAPGEEPAAVESGEKIPLTMQMSVYVEAPHKKAFDMLEERYEELNPGVDIIIYGAPYAEYWDKLTTEIVAGTEACIVQLQGGPSRYATYAALREGETGAFVNLDPYIEGTEWEDILITQDEMKYNDHYIGISNYAWGARAVYYRKSLFEEAGIDPASIITTEDFLDAAIKLTKEGEGGEPDQYGFGAVLSTHSFVWDEMKTFISRPPSGGIFTPGDDPAYTPDQVSVNSDAMVWAWQWWQDMIFEHQVVPPGSYDKADERDLFWNGTVAMNIDGPWFVGMTREYDPELLEDLGVLASPDVLYEGESYPFHGEIYAITNLISSNCEYPEEAWQFMEWMAGDEAQAIVAVSGMIPANINYSGNEEYGAMEPLNAELSQLVQERYQMPADRDPNIPQAGEMSRVMIDAAQEAFIGGADVQETLDKAAEEIKEILSE